MAEPNVIARVKASTTRSRVTPRLKNNAPDLASALVAARTTGGAGSFASPASSAAIHQVARKMANDSRRSTSVSGDRMIERAGIELLRRSNQFAAADPRQHAIENARIGLFVGDGAAWNAFAISIAIGAERCSIRGASQRRNRFPLGIRGRKNLLCRAGHRDEARDRVLVGIAPRFVEDVADHR